MRRPPRVSGRSGCWPVCSRSTSRPRVADLDLAGGHVDDAFERLLDLFAQLPAAERAPVRERLVELFGLVGPGDPRVAAARTRLTSLLF